MLERWRRWAYKRYEAQIAKGEFEALDKLNSGPWTPDMVTKMPRDVLVKGPIFGKIDGETRRVIDDELARRLRPISPVISNVIAFFALIVSTIALFRTL